MKNLSGSNYNAFGFANLLSNSTVQLIGLFLVALAVRLLYVKLAIGALGFEKFAFFANDTRLYLAIADHIVEPNSTGSYGLLRVGPGFGLILAFIKIILGPNLLWPIMWSVLMGALSPVLIYILGLKLFGSKPIAITAGLFSAFSFTSLSASAHILTDQSFFTFHLAALVGFVHAYQTGKIRWFIIAALLAGMASYIRAIGMAWPLVFIFLSLVLPLNGVYKNRKALLKKGLLTGLLMLSMIWGWSARNYIIHDKFIFGTNGMLTVRSCLIAQVAQNTWNNGWRITDYRDIWEYEDGDRSEDFAPAYDKARVRVVDEFKRQPLVVINCYMHNLLENMTAGNGYITREIPQVRSFTQTLNTAVEKWLGYLIMILTVIGLVLMYRLGMKFQFWVLGLTYFSFSIFLGASFWQGSRLHYPAEMAWPLVLTFLIVWTFSKTIGSRSK